MEKKVKLYGIIEQEVLYMKGLSMRGKLVWCALKTYTNNGKECFPSQETLAEGLDINQYPLSNVLGSESNSTVTVSMPRVLATASYPSYSPLST